jgi:D-cysteine desulfhydrase family pyridoxal phosphate-dependent enzyme
MSEGVKPELHRAGRVELAHTPTPLQPLPALSRALGGPEIWIKRDDCTGLAFGGNKARKLEFLVAEARAAGADTLVTIGAGQSNHVRMTAAAARACGLESVSILFQEPGGADPRPEGNLLLDRILGSTIEILPFGLAGLQARRLDEAVQEILARQRAAGRTPWFIPAGGAVASGCLGYLRATEETAHQARQKAADITRVVLAVGTGGTIAGLLLGVDALRLRWRVDGISVLPEGAIERSGIAPIATLAREAGELIGYEYDPARVPTRVSYDWVGPDYGVLTPEAAEAIHLVARTEGILLDPVYTGKSMAGLIGMIRSGQIESRETVLFLHTGGAPALFAHPEILEFA